LKNDINDDKEEEYYVPIDFEYIVDITADNWYERAIHAWEINYHFNTSYRFRQTVFQLPYKFAEYITPRFSKKEGKSQRL